MTVQIEHRNPPTQARPVGYAHSTLVTGGSRALLLGGVTAMDQEGRIEGPGDLVAQMDRALANLVDILQHSGATPAQIARIRIYTTAVPIYRARVRELGALWKKHLGKNYPAMALLGVAELFDPEALIEIECEAYLD